MPINSPLGGSWPAKARTWPFAPIVTPLVPLAASTSSTMVPAVCVGTSVAPSKVMVAYATFSSLLMGLVASIAAAVALSILACTSGGSGKGLGSRSWLGQPEPYVCPYGELTQATPGRSANFSINGVTVCLTSASVTVPESTPHTRFAVAPDAASAPAVSESRFCATCDSVPGNSKESLSSPPNLPPSTPITRNTTNHEMIAMTGLRTAQRARCPMELPHQIVER